jgi:hypothetical protein
VDAVDDEEVALELLPHAAPSNPKPTSAASHSLRRRFMAPELSDSVVTAAKFHSRWSHPDDREKSPVDIPRR